VKRIGQLLHALENGLLTLLVAGLIGLAGLQIVARVVFDTGFLWADGLLRNLVVWAAMLGAMAAARDGKHLAVDLLPHIKNDWLRRVGGLLAQGFAAVLCAVLAWYCLQLVQLEREGGALAFASVPTWVAQLILPFGFAVMALRFAGRAVRALLPREAAA